MLRRGQNSQGTLLISAKTIKDLKCDKMSFFQRSISVYNRIFHADCLDDMPIAKKMCSSSSQSNTSDVGYIAVSYLDKSKESKLLQLYIRIQKMNEKSVLVLEKSVHKSENGNMWRVMGVI
jgi:hypothetical protein